MQTITAVVVLLLMVANGQTILCSEHYAVISSSNDLDDASIAYTGDYLFVGAANADYEYTDDDEDVIVYSSGEVHVYKYDADDAEWKLSQTLAASSPRTQHMFGSYISAAGSFAIIASPGGNTVYIYELVGDTWDRRAIFNGMDGIHDVSISESGYAVVGAPLNSDSASLAGKSWFIYKEETDDWYRTSIVPNNIEAGMMYGQSVSVYGDLVVVGVAAWEHEARKQGSAIVYQVDGSNITLLDSLSIGTASGTVRFGSSVSIYEETIMVGSHEDEFDPSFNGKVYIYERGSSGWTLSGTLTPQEHDYSLFGLGIELQDDWVAVSRPVDGKGAVFIFEKSNGEWSETALYAASDANLDYDDESIGYGVGRQNTTMFISTSSGVLYYDLSSCIPFSYPKINLGAWVGIAMGVIVIVTIFSHYLKKHLDRNDLKNEDELVTGRNGEDDGNPSLYQKV